MADNEGTGATITFGTSGFTGTVIGIGPLEVTRAAVESHALTDTHANVEPSSVEEWTVDIAIEQSFTDALPYNAAPETITITEALLSGQTVAGNLAGSGWCERVAWNFPWRARKEATARIRYSAKPTLTAGS